MWNLRFMRSRTITIINKFCRERYLNHNRHVSMWTPLGATFNAKTVPHLRLDFLGKNSGLFGIEELTVPTGFYLLKDRAIEATDRLIAESLSANRKRKMVTIFDELSDTLCQVADLAEFIRVAHPDHKYVIAAEDASVSINALVERLNTNQDIYRALRNVVENGDVVPTDQVDQHVAKLFLFDFEQSGIHLSEGKRARVVRLNEAILQIGALFTQSVSLPTVVPKQSLPENIRHFFPMDGDNIVVSSLQADNANEMVREAAYKIYMYPNERQEGRLLDLLTSRAELAELCGFPTFAHRVLTGSLAQSPDVVNRFLHAMSVNLQPYAKNDFRMIENAKVKKQGRNKGLQVWDMPYFSALIKNEKYKLDISDYMPYFSLGTCMEGLNLLFESLYRVTLEPQKTLPSELWTPEIYKLAVTHETEGVLGFVYCDFYERPGKPNQDCHFTIRGGRELPDGSYQLPIVVLMLNFPSPSWNSPCMLTPGMIENLFHEMGHAMHSMLGRTKYQHVTGTRCSTDFAEVPSVLMEYFASDPRVCIDSRKMALKVLARFARDYKSGENIPYEMLLKLCKSKASLAASELQLQIFYSALDQSFHGDLSRNGLNSNRTTTTDVLSSVQKQYYSLPHAPQTSWQHRFQHLVGYGAKYYSYLFSKAVASWIWQKNFDSDPFSSISGERYRQEVLAHGGGKPPKQLLEAFLKEEVTPEALVEFLISEVDNKQHMYDSIS